MWGLKGKFCVKTLNGVSNPSGCVGLRFFSLEGHFWYDISKNITTR